MTGDQLTGDQLAGDQLTGDQMTHSHDGSPVTGFLVAYVSTIFVMGRTKRACKKISYERFYAIFLTFIKGD